MSAPFDPAKAHAFFTLSIPIEGDAINQLIVDCLPAAPHRPGGTAARVWDQRLLEQMQGLVDDTEALQAAINPMFDDIADRDRNLFVKDFLLDTPNPTAAPAQAPGAVGGPGPPGHLRNTCRRVTLELQDEVHWSTEGVTSSVELSAPVAFADVLCRAFWMVHSNHALSYHLSFEVAFAKGLEAYYGLSMLLKAFNPSEGTGWVLGDAGWLVHQPAHQPARPAQRLLDFIEALFEEHAGHLFGKLAPNSAGRVSEAVVKAVSHQAWQRLVLAPERERSRRRRAEGPWPSSERRRLLVILRDDELFRTVDRARNEPELFASLSPMKADAGSYRRAALRAHFEAQAAALKLQTRPPDSAAFTAAEIEQVVFLSGFFQNVVDFMEQDDLEVRDGISPLYPSKEDGAVNDGYRVYATPRIMFEMVASSRSLDHAGRTWLGTCPYLFLVHVTAMHNEGIVRNYERRVTELIERLASLGITADALGAGTRSRMQLRRAFEEIKQFRLLTFEQVHKHLSFNVFRYDTEKTFFTRLEELRGTASRRTYWDEVLKHLMETVDSLNADNATRHGLFLSTLGFFLALTGVLQLLIAIFPDALTGPYRQRVIGAGLVGSVALIVGFNQYLKRRWNATSK